MLVILGGKGLTLWPLSKTCRGNSKYLSVGGRLYHNHWLGILSCHVVTRRLRMICVVDY